MWIDQIWASDNFYRNGISQYGIDKDTDRTFWWSLKQSLWNNTRNAMDASVLWCSGKYTLHYSVTLFKPTSTIFIYDQNRQSYFGKYRQQKGHGYYYETIEQNLLFSWLWHDKIDKLCKHSYEYLSRTFFTLDTNSKSIIITTLLSSLT